MASVQFKQARALAEQLDPVEQLYLIQFLAPRIAQAVQPAQIQDTATETMPMENGFRQQLAEIHKTLRENGYRFRSKEEIDKQIDNERNSWG